MLPLAPTPAASWPHGEHTADQQPPITYHVVWHDPRVAASRHTKG